MEKGDYVVRLSYNKDIIFRIKEIDNDNYILEGVFIRLIADSPIEDLELVLENQIREKEEEDNLYHEQIINQVKKKSGYLLGKILHIDGDKKYLDKCMKLYNDVGIYAKGYYLDEKDFENKILEFMQDYNPDIVVITGHDSYNKRGLRELNNYVNSINFFKAVKKIRNKFSKDDVLIIAGACQSNFEALIAAGANFATSKERVNIHAFDPSIIAIKASVTPFNRIINIKDIFNFSLIKGEGIGGIESYGKMRLLI